MSSVVLRVVKFENPKDFSSTIEFQQFISVEEGKTKTLGRSRKCNLRIPDDFCSSEHCFFFFTGKELYITDNNSKNGTKVNGIFIEQKIQLFHKDIIIIGNTFIHIDEEKTEKDIIAKLRRKEDGTISISNNKNYQDITSTKIKNS